VMLQRSMMIAMLVLLATPAAAEWWIPCLWSPFGGCSVIFVSPEYAARPSWQPLNPRGALDGTATAPSLGLRFWIH
jgi:hypothetical protein